MRNKIVVCLSALVLLPFSICLAQEEKIAEIRVHGNYSTPDAKVIELSGLSLGDTASDEAIEESRKRLLKSGLFESVELLKRSRSLTEEGPVVIVIMVKEKESIPKKFMFMPIFELTDEYGLTYGVRVAMIDLLGLNERISFPLSWGGVKQAAAETTIDIGSFGLATHALALYGGRIRRENPHYEIAADRLELRAGWKTRLKWLLAGVDAARTNVRFDQLDETFYTYGVRLAFDTRQDVNLPYDAVYLGYRWELMSFREAEEDIHRNEIDLRGFKKLLGQSVLAAQFYYSSVDAPLPAYQKPFLGGGATLRGHKAGKYIGDNIALASLELRLPLNSVMAYYRWGLNFFVDGGAVFDYGTELRDAERRYGAGAGIWLFAAIVGLKVEVAHDLEDSVRLSFSTGFRF
jgi:outer membrane protein assembly factor BamA